jgi:hypothetical protein
MAGSEANKGKRYSGRAAFMAWREGGIGYRRRRVF